MKTHVIVLAMVAATATAQADVDQVVSNLEIQIQQAWYRDSETRAWLLADGAFDGLNQAPCSKLLEELRIANVPASRTIELTDDSRDLPRGRHALPAVRAACDRIEVAGKIKEFERWATLAGESTGPDYLQALENCLATYDAIIKAGVQPDDQVPRRRVMIGRELVMWSGSIAEVRVKYCDAGIAIAKAEIAKREAPLRKVLKRDKLALALGFNATAAYALPGGDWSMNPAKLAASPVWFDTTGAPSHQAQVCAGGARRTVVRRYTFGAQHQLVKTTSKEYCGEPPASAFR